MPQAHIREEHGVVMSLGANVRPRDPNEDKYHFMTTVRRKKTVDLTQPRLLSAYKASDGKVYDYRVNITDQQRLGSCAAWTAVESEGTCRNLDGQNGNDLLHAGVLYELVRQEEGSFPTDAGSAPADCIDLAMAGLPLLSDYAYMQDAGFTYPDSVVHDRDGYNVVLSHRPFYPKDGQVLENIWTALDQQMPVAIATAWLNEWFNPTHGILQAGLSGKSAEGGHSILCWGIAPLHGRVYLLCANHWSTGWAKDAAQSGLPTMRPGDFAIPGEYLTRKSPLIFECRAITKESVS